MGVTHFLLLSCLGLVITAQAQDCSRPVGGANMNLKGDDIHLKTFPDGTKVTFACDVGYVSVGGFAIITCTAGSWNPVGLRCEKKSCGSLGDVENGHPDYPDGNEFGSKAVITCNEGYMLVGRDEIFCGDQGWMGRLPTCEAATCDPPRTVDNGNFNPVKEVYEYGDAVHFSCQRDFTLNGSKSIVCSSDGKLKPDPPTCTKVECEDHDVPNADWIGGSRPPHRYQATVTYKCRSGYEMIGEPTLTCDINSQWSPGLPQCKKSTKSSTTTTTTSTTTTTQPPKDNGHTREITVGVVLAVLAVVGGVLVFVYIKKRKGDDKDSDDKKPTKPSEEVPLGVKPQEELPHGP